MNGWGVKGGRALLLAARPPRRENCLGCVVNTRWTQNPIRKFVWPTRSFSFPHELVNDPSLSYGEKQTILSEWASDACAVDSFPLLRRLPGTPFPVTLRRSCRRASCSIGD